MSKVRTPLVVVVAATVWMSCREAPRETPGQLRLALSVAASHDVAAIRVTVSPGDDCHGSGGHSRDIPLQPQGLRPDLLGSGAGNGHPFADGLFVLPPGSYAVCALPLNASGAPSAVCMAARATAHVFPQTTTEVALISNCAAAESGGLDVIVALNSPPRIEDLTLTPDKFISRCESLEVTIAASDPDGDAIGYAWTVASSPTGRVPTLTNTGNTATFTPDGPGDYQIKVTVTDSHGASASLTFPVYVSATCDEPIVCPDGSTASSVAECVSCPAGTFSSGGSECTACPVGRYAPPGSNSCIACPDGTTSTEGLDGCTECPAGTSSSGGSECTACPVGRYAPPGSNSCIPCPDGTTSPDEGSQECFKCPPGTASTGGNACTPCPAGTFAADASSLECKPCPPGTSSAPGATACSQ